jgi:hypothetical protein
MEILVHEFITGGGLAGQELPSSLAKEGFRILNAILEDFSYLPQHRIITSCDDRLNLKLPAHEVIPVKKETYEEVFLSLVKTADAVLPIAPETDGILANLTAIVEKERKFLLNSTVEGIEMTGNKALTYKQFEKRGIPFPKTEVVSFKEDVAGKAERLGFPLILKPLDGVGCSGIFLLKSVEEIAGTLLQLIQETRHNQFLIQRYAQGIHASVSAISNGICAIPLTLNAQYIEETNRLTYKGGLAAIEHPLKQEIFRWVQDLPEWIKGLKGYIGIDLVLTEKGPVFIEVNPRLTTSYIGVRSAVPFNLAEAIVHAAIDGVLPKEVNTMGQVPFTL